MPLFTADDVVQFAIRIEENGEVFYREAERSATNAEAKALFKRLADDEIQHKKVFTKMLSQLKGDSSVTSSNPGEDYPGEFMEYLRHYVDGKVIFTPGGGAPGGGDTKAAVDAAIRRELDAVLYYQELKNHVGAEDGKILDSIIDEERKHFQLLSDVRKKLS